MASISQALASLSEGLKEDRLSRRDEMQFALGLMQFQSERAWRKEESERQQFAANITMLEADNQKQRKRHAAQLVNDLSNISGTPLIIGNENVESNFKDWQEDFMKAWNPSENETLKYEAGELISLVYNYRLNPDSDSATEDILNHGRMMYQRYLTVTEGDFEDPVVEAYAQSGLFGRTYMVKDEATGKYVRGTDRSMVEESKRFYHNLMVTEDLQYKLAQERAEFVTGGDTEIQSDVDRYKAPGEAVGQQAYWSEDEMQAFIAEQKAEQARLGTLAGVVGEEYQEFSEVMGDYHKTEADWKKAMDDFREAGRLMSGGAGSDFNIGSNFFAPGATEWGSGQHMKNWTKEQKAEYKKASNLEKRKMYPGGPGTMLGTFNYVPTEDELGKLATYIKKIAVRQQTKGTDYGLDELAEDFNRLKNARKTMLEASETRSKARELANKARKTYIATI